MFFEKNFDELGTLGGILRLCDLEIISTSPGSWEIVSRAGGTS